MEGSCVWGSPDHSQVQGSAPSKHSITLMAEMYCSGRTQRKSGQGSQHTGRLQGTGTSSQESSPREVTQAMFNSSSTELRQHMWGVIYLGSSLKLPCPGFLLGAMDTLYLTRTLIPDSQRRKQLLSMNHTICAHSPGPGRHADQSGNGGNIPEIQVPRHQPQAKLASRLF